MKDSALTFSILSHRPALKGRIDLVENVEHDQKVGAFIAWAG
jgi:hypothetical protein